MQGYTLAQVRGFAAAIARAEASRDARLLSLLAVGVRGDARQFDQLLDQLLAQLQSTSY